MAHIQDPVTRQMRAARRAIREAERALAALVVALSKQAESEGDRRVVTVSPERRAALRLQGTYMGYMRQLGQRQKQRVRVARERRGIRAGIALAKRLAGK